MAKLELETNVARQKSELACDSRRGRPDASCDPLRQSWTTKGAELEIAVTYRAELTDVCTKKLDTCEMARDEESRAGAARAYSIRTETEQDTICAAAEQDASRTLKYQCAEAKAVASAARDAWRALSHRQERAEDRHDDALRAQKKGNVQPGTGDICAWVQFWQRAVDIACTDRQKSKAKDALQLVIEKCSAQNRTKGKRQGT